MKKRNIGALLLTCAFVSAALVGCNNQNEEKKEVTIDFWTNFYGDSQTSWINERVKEYKEIEPNVTINWEGKGRYAAIKEAIDQVVNTPDKLPSIAVVYPDYVYNYIEEDVVLDMSSYMNDSKYGFGKTVDSSGNVIEESDTKASDFNNAFLKEGQEYQVKGTYSLPLSKTSEVMYYNETEFNKHNYSVPSTWSELIDLARQIRKDYPSVYTDENKGNAGSGSVAPIGYDSYDNMFITFAKMLDIPYGGNTDTNGNGHIDKEEAVKFNNESTYKMVRMIKDWYDEGLITIKDTLNFSEKGSHYINEPFTSGESLIVLNSTTGTSWCATDSFLPSIAPMPGMDSNILEGKEVKTKNAKVMSQGPSVCFFDKDESTNLEAWKFYKWLTNTTNSAGLSNAYGGAPTRTSAYSTDTLKEVMKSKDKGTVSTGNGSTDDEKAYMLSNVYDAYETYSSNEQSFIAPVSQFSSAARTAVGDALYEVLVSKETGSSLDAFIKTTFTTAYENI